MKRPRVVAIAIGAALLALLAVPWIGRLRRPTDVPTLVVSKAGFERRVVAEGNLEAADATPVTAPVDAQGQLKVAWLIPDGTPVKTGDVVVRFDPSEMERSLRDGESDESAAKSRITGMRADTEARFAASSATGLGARGGGEPTATDRRPGSSRQEIIRSEIDRSLATHKTSDAVRSILQDVAKVDLDLLDIERRRRIDRPCVERLEALEIKPHDGILVFKRDWRGEIAKVGDTLWLAAGRDSERKTMQARVYVLEADAGGLTGPTRDRGRRSASVNEYRRRSKVDTLAKRRKLNSGAFGATLERRRGPRRDEARPARARRLSLDARPRQRSSQRHLRGWEKSSTNAGRSSPPSR